jgi:hypothetical protein
MIAREKVEQVIALADEQAKRAKHASANPVPWADRVRRHVEKMATGEVVTELEAFLDALTDDEVTALERIMRLGKDGYDPGASERHVAISSMAETLYLGRYLRDGARMAFEEA